MVILVLSQFVTCLCILLAVAFYTLLERNVLGYTQIRNGPNNIGVFGILQPFSDAVKLFTNENNTPGLSNNRLFQVSPILMLLLALSILIVLPNSYGASILNYSLLTFLIISGLNVYCVILTGWASNSKYAFLGSVRGVAQFISYEVSFVTILFVPILICSHWSLLNLKTSFAVGLIFPLLIFVFFASVVAETNRAPFDLAEGESELVSGYNVEYSAHSFAFVFLAEYANILTISAVTVGVFLFSSSMLGITTFWLIVSYAFLMARASYPRMRYDTLMLLCWNSFLPYSLFCLLLCLPVLI